MTVRRLIALVAGLLFGLAIGFAGVAVLVLLALGAGGHWLVRQSPGTSNVINYDPSQIAAKATYPALLGLLLLIVFVAIAIRLGRRDRRAVEPGA